MVEANGAVPGTRRAVALSHRYRAGGSLRLLVEQLLGGHAVPRPRTPAYPLLTSLFQQAFDRIRSGGDVKSILDRAAAEIDDEIEDNKGYPWIEPVRQGKR